MQKGFAPVLILVGMLLIAMIAGGAVYFGKLTIPFPKSPTPSPTLAPKACTQEAKICPDGSAVGRTGPNCEFAPCPSPNKTDETTNWETYFNTDKWIVYNDKALTISLKHPQNRNPTKQYIPQKSNLIVTNQFNFDSSKIPLCKTYNGEVCLMPGKNFSQEKDIQPIVLAGRAAISFYVSAGEIGSPVVWHVVHTIKDPIVEIAHPFDGMGDAETFQLILSTVEFLE